MTFFKHLFHQYYLMIFFNLKNLLVLNPPFLYYANHLLRQTVLFAILLYNDHLNLIDTQFYFYLFKIFHHLFNNLTQYF